MKKTDWPWDMHAEAFLRTKFLPRTFGQAFLTEQFVKSADKAGVPLPADLHAVGGFITRMKYAGVIRRTGFALDKFGSPKSLWRSV